MKKIITTILAASMMLLGANAFAQVSVGAGYLNSTDRIKSGSSSVDNTYNGIYAGLVYNVSLGNGLGLAPGIYYSFLSKNDAKYNKISADTQEQYLTVPVMFNYGLELAPAATLRLYAGPSFAYGLSSKFKTSGNVNIPILGDLKLDADTSTDLYKNSDYQRFDVLLGGGVALDLAYRFRINCGYDFGLIDRDGDSGDSDNSRHRNQLHVGVAYLF